MKKEILFVILFLFGVYGNTQEQLSYNSKSGNIQFTVSLNEFYVEFDQKDVAIFKTFGKGNLKRVSKNAVIVAQEGLTGDFSTRKRQLNNLFSNILLRIEPVLI